MPMMPAPTNDIAQSVWRKGSAWFDSTPETPPTHPSISTQAFYQTHGGQRATRAFSKGVGGQGQRGRARRVCFPAQAWLLFGRRYNQKRSFYCFA